MRTGKLVSIIGAALVLAACGSEKAKPTRNIAYTGPTGNAPIASSQSVGPIAGEVGNVIDSFSGMAVTPPPSLPGVAGSFRAPSFKDAAKIAAKYRAKIAPATLSGVTAAVTADCLYSGTWTYQTQFASQTVTSNDDYIQISFAMCADDDSGMMMDGSMRFEIVNTDGKDFLDDPSLMTPGFGYSVRVVYGNLAFVLPEGLWIGMNGDIAFTQTAVTATTPDELRWWVHGQQIAMGIGIGADMLAGQLLTGPGGVGEYSDLYVEEFAGGLSLYATASAKRWDFDGRVCSTQLNGCLDVVTNPEFRQLAPLDYGYPEAGGAFTVSNDVAYIRVTALDSAGDVNVTYDLNDSDAIPAVSFNTTWDCLYYPDSCQ